jgi:hypothetical protein
MKDKEGLKAPHLPKLSSTRDKVEGGKPPSIKKEIKPTYPQIEQQRGKTHILCVKHLVLVTRNYNSDS